MTHTGVAWFGSGTLVWGPLLLLGLFLLPTAVAGQEAISEIAVVGGTSPSVGCPAGFTKIDYDLNRGAEGDFIYLCYRRGGPDPPVSAVTVVGGPNIDCPAGLTKIEYDLNRGAEGDLIYVCYSKAPSCSVLSDLEVVGGGSFEVECPEGFTKVDYDLNRGAGGDFIYLCYREAGPEAAWCASALCSGDCSGNGEVSIDELITCVNVALGTGTLGQCLACDGNGDGKVTINDLITGVGVALGRIPCDPTCPSQAFCPGLCDDELIGSNLPEGSAQSICRCQVCRLNGHATAQVLKEIGFAPAEVGATLRDVFAFNVVEIYEALTEIYGLTDIEVENALAGAGFKDEEFLWISAARYVSEFAPVLKFDRGASTFPMDAQKWFEEMLCGEDGGPPENEEGSFDYASCLKKPVGWGNNSVSNLWQGSAEFSTLEEDGFAVPTYYKMRRCGTTGQLRIEFWWFYGWQPNDDVAGISCGQQHSGDWEHIMITTSQDRQQIAAVTYYQHSGHYTRIHGSPPPGWETEDGHPVVYVGKTAHGSYHDNGGSGSCLYYEDYRNPKAGNVWRTGETPLVNLDGAEQDWLTLDRTARWKWGEVTTHPTVKTPDFCMVAACEGVDPFFKGGAGCLYGKSECKTGDCWCGDVRCSSSCLKCFVSWYHNDYYIPTSDWGIIAP